MPIEFACPCGKSYSVDESLAGKRTKCPACKAALVVPTPPPPEEFGDFEILEDEEDEVVEDFEYAEDEPEPVAAVADKQAPKSDGFPPDEISENTIGYECGFGGTNVYRIVRVGNELLFLDAGPFFQGLNSAQSSVEGAAAGAGQGGITGGLMAGAIAGSVAALDEIKQAKAEKRAEKLDKMSAKQMRAESEEGKVSFRAKADDLSDVRFDKLSFFRDNQRPKNDCAGVLRFSHATAGDKRLYLVKMAELKKAVYLFVDILGPKAVTVNLAVKKKRKR
ncbi:hypothetical protein [Limnoglobus roseus]|uniref:Uncharacterized protein n=1 Tax=Limnoglobus roseus TaxID=2598579 RepID=A0A5C1AC38_9BACT|nr:hypothetical protein [Limnoglobus roseus]QEL14588.1 hypothetical protein PX52LOC_01478 [Limnoglobus roseus]